MPAWMAATWCGDCGRRQSTPVTSPAKVGASRLIDMPKRLSSAMRIGKTGSANGGTISTDPGSDDRGYRVGVGTGRHVDARQPRETDVNRLDGKVVLISGQRAASARLMVEAGAKVAVGDAIPYAYLDLRRCE